MNNEPWMRLRFEPEQGTAPTARRCSLALAGTVRLRRMAGSSEALALFHLPFPPKGGIPGVHFRLPVMTTSSD